MNIFAPLDRLLLGPKRPPTKPQVFFKINGQRRRFNPKPDITAYELAQIQIFIAAGRRPRWDPMDTAGWWQDVGPSVQRHFHEPEPTAEDR